MSEISSSPQQWFYEVNGQRLGGVDEAALIEMIRTKQLGYGSLVWCPGLSGWQTLESTSLRLHLEAVSPPPLAGQHINNSLVWILAFAPVLGFMLELLVASIVYGGNEDRAVEGVTAGYFIYITLALNILLSVLDEKRLQRAGHNTERFKGWVWLVPVYLYQRARALQHSLAYLITWIACFSLMLLMSLAGGAWVSDSHSVEQPYIDALEGKSLEDILSEPVEADY